MKTIYDVYEGVLDDDFESKAEKKILWDHYFKNVPAANDTVDEICKSHTKGDTPTVGVFDDRWLRLNWTKKWIFHIMLYFDGTRTLTVAKGGKRPEAYQVYWNAKNPTGLVVCTKIPAEKLRLQSPANELPAKLGWLPKAVKACPNIIKN